MVLHINAHFREIAPPLPEFGYLYAADQKASFLRGFLRLGVGEPNVRREGCWIPYGLPLDCRINQFQNNNKQS